MKHWSDILKNVSMLTQFGWIYLPGFFFGLGGCASVAWKMYRSLLHRQEKEEKKEKAAFNRHI